MVDWGIHYIHNLRKVLDLGLLNKVSAIGGIVKNFTSDNPDYLDVKFDFGGLPVYWSQKSWGVKSPMPDNDIGVYYYGEKATIFAGDLGWAIYSADGTKKVVGSTKFEPWIPEIGAKYSKMCTDLFVEFAEGIRNKSNAKITNTLEDAQKTTSCVIYGDMAYRVNAGLSINPTNMNIENNAEAQKMLKRAYRASFQHPYIL